MSAQTSDTNKTVTVNSTDYTVDTTKMPYFTSHTSPYADLPHFSTALLCVETGLHSAFAALKTDITTYPILCQTLKLLGVDVLGSRSLTQLADQCKSNTFSKELSADAIFRLLYMQHTSGFGPQHRGKLFEIVSYVLTHHYYFDHIVRSVLRETYRTMMGPTAKQLVAVEKWPVYGADGVPVGSYSYPGDDDDDYYCDGSDSDGFGY